MIACSCPALQGPGLSQHTRSGLEAVAVTLEELRHRRNPKAEPPSIPRRHQAHSDKQLRTLASSGRAQVALNTNTVTCVHSHV